MPAELLLFIAPVLLLGLLLLRDLPVFGLLACLILARAAFDGPFNLQVAGNPLSGVLGILILGLGIASGIRGWRGFIPVLALGGVLFVSSQSALLFDADAISEYIRLMSVIAVFVIVANLRSRPGPRAVVTVIQLTALTSAVFSLIQFATGGGLVVDGVLRATGTMAHPNSAALLYCMAISASVIAYFELGRRRLDLVVAAVLFVALLSTGSVGGIVALAAMLCAYILLSPRVARNVRIGVPVLAAAGVIGFLLSPLGAERVSEFVSLDLSGASGERNSLEWRIGRWQDVLTYWEQSPIFGVGYGAAAGGALLNGYPPHNEYVRAIVELGLLGIVVIAILIVATLRALRRVARTGEAAGALATLGIAMLGGMLVNAIAENTFMYSVPGYLLAVTIASALWRPLRSTSGASLQSMKTYERKSHFA
ncbi:O-antigen ligase family protein [Microbacterium sp. QXD-8]|uniref:O-antigen ligase family protein n=1 Tax=Microbacterium psychrotolerans TaxID=3068321 RepID=A0ABU0Z1A7_9MICO|nr:O-antigen ligase family protein [Microbacterium sp. QXD-8]MDQ7878361.1 O-antigen ligase family protein [Microbacterium sp. QXD-8]